MNFDRNTVIGFIVLALLFGGYFWWNSKEQAAARAEKARQDSIVKANAPKIDTVTLKTESAKNDSIAKIRTAGGFQKAVIDTERTFVINNNVLEITFSSRGGQCSNCAMLFAKTEGSCDYCGGAIGPVNDLVERMVERVLESDGKVEEVEGEAANRLQQIGGIGAFLRF